MWKKIKDLENYEISNTGELRNSNGKILKLQPLKGAGYLTKVFYNKGNRVNKYIHRLVAEAFIPNPNNLPQVNHINGNKTDNRVENLEWCSASYNTQHAYDNGLATPPHQIRIKCVETGEVFDSITSASRNLNISITCIKNCIDGRYKSTHNLHFVKN